MSWILRWFSVGKSQCRLQLTFRTVDVWWGRSIHALATRRQWSVKVYSARRRKIANNINKNTSSKTLQPERKTDFKLPIKPLDYPIRALRVCKRATVESRKDHSCIAAVAILQACWGPFRPVFGIGPMLIKFKWLIASALKASPKFAYLRRVDCRLQISQSQGPKVSK